MNFGQSSIIFSPTSLFRPDIAEQSGEVTRSVSGPLLARYYRVLDILNFISILYYMVIFHQILIFFIMLAFLNSRKNYGHPEIHMERQVMPRLLAGASGPTDWNEALDIISFGSPEQVFISSPSTFHQLWGKSMSCLNLQVVV